MNYIINYKFSPGANIIIINEKINKIPQFSIVLSNFFDIIFLIIFCIFKRNNIEIILFSFSSFIFLFN